MLYSDKHKCIFIHVPKCAGTSIEKSLGLDFVLKKTLPLTVHRWHCNRQTFIDKLGQQRFDNYYKFSFVRNPWDRVVSAWRMFETKSWCKLDRSYSLPEFVDIVLNDKINFVARYRTNVGKALWQRSLENVRHHTLPASHPYYGLIEDGELTVDFCGRFESLQSDFAVVANRLGLTMPLLHELKTERNTDYRTYFKDAGLIRALGEYYREDCRLFNYEF